MSGYYDPTTGDWVDTGDTPPPPDDFYYTPTPDTGDTPPPPDDFYYTPTPTPDGATVRPNYRDLDQSTWNDAEWLDYYAVDSYSPDNAIPGGYVPSGGKSDYDLLKFFGKLFTGQSSLGKAGQLAGMAGVASVLNRMMGGSGGSPYRGYSGGIPTLTASRTMLPPPPPQVDASGAAIPRRPGSGGIAYFSPMTYTRVPPPAPTPTPAPTPAPDTDTTPAASGGLMGLAAGGRLLRGPGDGVSDSIPAQFTNGRPARLADGEFVLDARTVSEIGNGSTEAGARKLYAMLKRIHSARKKATRGEPSNADKYLPR